MMAILEARGLQAGHGAAAIVRDFHLSVGAGEVHVLLGPNGAGKTTTLLTLAGAIPALGGEVVLNGSATRAPLHRRAKQGLSLITEERSVFMQQTARDNLRLGGCTPQRALELFPELEPHLGRRVGLLSGGQQQMLTLARALARTPKVLLADELSLGLAPMIVGRLLAAVRAAADEGLAVILVEQHVTRALAVADRASVLVNGRIVLEGSAAELRSDPGSLAELYLAAGVASTA